jgi:hypothetical protein
MDTKGSVFYVFIRTSEYTGAQIVFENYPLDISFSFFLELKIHNPVVNFPSDSGISINFFAANE